jgi:uncharacterized membrane protein required for colicin V production
LFEFARIYIAFLLAATLGNAVGDLIVGWLPNLPAPICNALGYVAAFLLALVLIRFVARFLTELIDHIKLVGTLNRVLGALLGLLVAFAFLMVISSVFKTFFVGKPIYEETVVLKFLGDSVLPSVKLFDLSGF